MVISGGSIIEIGPGADAAGASRLDADGLILLPGLRSA